MKAPSVNVVVIAGNLGADPDLKYTSKGTPVLTLRLCVNRNYKKDGEWKTELMAWNVVQFGEFAEKAAENLRKGAVVVVTGKLQGRSYESQGVKKYVTEIIADRIAEVKLPKSDQAQGEPGAAPTSDVPPDSPAGDEPF